LKKGSGGVKNAVFGAFGVAAAERNWSVQEADFGSAADVAGLGRKIKISTSWRRADT